MKKPTHKDIHKIVNLKHDELIQARAAEDLIRDEQIRKIKVRLKRDDIIFKLKMILMFIGVISFFMGFINLEKLQGSLRLILGF